jgi:hypothetical protein
MDRRFRLFVLGAVFLLTVVIAGCGGNSGGDNGSGGSPAGQVSISLTDGPGDYDHVWITVCDLWFHKSDSSGPEDSGWHRFPLSSPVTVDLLSLGNGNVGNPVLDGISLPAGQYQQIRLVLAGTEDALTDSAAAEGLTYNNEVVIGSTHYPLRVPDAKHGIKLAGTFTVAESGHLRLVLDFNVNEDVVETDRNGATEYLLKPRLGYFDLDDAGAIVSHITPTAALPAGRFVVKAEQIGPDGVHYMVKRFTVPNPATGRFVLYPLWPGTYDLVLRGLGHKTVIIRGVSVTRGTTPASGATSIPPIAMPAAGAPDHPVDGTIVSPTGAWVEFFQELADGKQYLVRFRHFNPLTGMFANFPLSNDDLLVGQFDGSVVTGLTTTTPAGGNGTFNAVARALLYEPSADQVVTSTTGTVSFGPLEVKAPAVARTVSGILTRPSISSAALLDRGVLFAVHGGMVVNALSIDGLLSGGTPSVSYVMDNLPGGTTALPFPGGLYGVSALAWASGAPGTAAASVPRIADLRTGDDPNADLFLLMLMP